MKKIAVCYKWVLSDEDIRVRGGSGELDLERCKPRINEYDRNALELGVQLKTACGAELVALTCGTATAASARDVLSRGPDALYYLDDPAMEQADSSVTSKALAAMLRTIGGVDAVICSEGSSDEYAQQVGPRLAALLGWPSVSYVSAARLDGDSLELERKLEDGTESVRLNGPAVISIVPDAADAPIPGVKQILSAKKKPATTLSLAETDLSGADLYPQITVNSVLAPKNERKSQCLNPSGVSIADAAVALIKHLSADGVL